MTDKNVSQDGVLITTYALRELGSLGRVQARYKIRHSVLFTKVNFRHRPEHPILHTYLENRILKQELNIQSNIKTSEAYRKIR